MLADKTFYTSNDSTNVFAPTFKPSAAQNGFQSSATGNPFVPTMPQQQARPAPFSMKAEFKAFVPMQASNAPFTPVSPAPKSLTQQGSMTMNTNPFAFSPAENSTFKPTFNSAPTMSESQMFGDDEEANMFGLDGQILPLNTKKYKREMCKNWTEVGFCRYGHKCQYAHGHEELAEIDRITEAQARLNEKYKSQNCRQFYREKLCPYGKRCHFRHEYRSFKKIHRHFYQAHVSAMAHTYEDILAEARNAPDGTKAKDQFTIDTSDSSFELEKEEQVTSDETSQINDHSRLSCFQFITEAGDNTQKEEESLSESNLSLQKTEDSLGPLTRTGSFTEKEIGRAEDFEMWSQCSLEVCE